MLETTNSCGRAEDLLAYLYAEATPDAARDFEGHLRRCDACRAELAAFGGVREAIGDWRLQVLAPLTHASAEPVAPMLFNTAAPGRASALAALREFFRLSSAWARAGAFAFGVLFCALAVIAVSHFVERPQTVFVERQVKSGYSQEEVEARLAEALKRQKESEEQPGAAPGSIQDEDDKQPRVAFRNRRERQAAPAQTAGVNRRRQAAELASADYLPFTASPEEEELPTLTDLVGDPNQE